MDVLTMEIEHIDVDALEYVVLHQGVDVQPRPATLRIIQVRLTGTRSTEGPQAVAASPCARHQVPSTSRVHPMQSYLGILSAQLTLAAPLVQLVATSL